VKGGAFYNSRLDFLFRRILSEPTQDIFELIGRKEEIEQAAHAMKAIAHPLRLGILCVLGDQEVSVQDIVDAVGTSQSNISQHLAILRDKKILITRKDANRVYYSVSDKRTLRLIAMMREVFCNGESRA
jgi:ArsR family transcriptional regulator